MICDLNAVNILERTLLFRCELLSRAGQKVPEASDVPAPLRATLYRRMVWKQRDANRLQGGKDVVDEWLRPRNLRLQPDRNCFQRTRRDGSRRFCEAAWRSLDGHGRSGNSKALASKSVSTTRNSGEGKAKLCSSSRYCGPDEANDGDFIRAGTWGGATSELVTGDSKSKRAQVVSLVSCWKRR